MSLPPAERLRAGDQADPAHVAAVVALARRARPARGTTVVVAVDGRSGSGKTLLGTAVADRLDCPVVHLDELYPGWDGLAAGVAHVTSQVLEPLASGERAAYRRWDWMRSRPGRTVPVGPTAMLVLEGCGALVPPADAFAAGASGSRRRRRCAGRAPSRATARRTRRTGSGGPRRRMPCTAPRDPGPRRPRPADGRLVKLASVRPARTRALHRLHDHWAHLLQIGVGVLLAWLVAERLLGHTQPFFAPVTAILCLGLTYGQRLRRILEVTVGVAIGVLVGDLIVAALGSGAWQMATVVVLAMGIATLVSSGLLVIQAGVQSVFIVAFVSDQGVGVARGSTPSWADSSPWPSGWSRPPPRSGAPGPRLPAPSVTS